MTYSQVWWPILGIRALHLPFQSAHTQQWTHTHREHTPEQWAAIFAASPGEQLGVQCLAWGHLIMVLKVERVLYINSPYRQCTVLSPPSYLQYFNAKWRRIWRRQTWWKWLRRIFFFLNDGTQYAYTLYTRCKESMLQLFKFYTCQHKECISTMLAHAPNKK